MESVLESHEQDLRERYAGDHRGSLTPTLRCPHSRFHHPFIQQTGTEHLLCVRYDSIVGDGAMSRPGRAMSSGIHSLGPNK